MSKVVKLLDLESFDNGQHRPPFLVPVGETVIGRGEFLKCKSTEVSRSHAVLKADKHGNLFLTTSNKKPCYHKKCGNADKTVLQENESVQLHHGDVFSLTAASSGYEVQLSENLSLPEGKDEHALHSGNGETTTVTPPTSKRKFPTWMEDSDEEKKSPDRKKIASEKKKASDESGPDLPGGSDNNQVLSDQAQVSPEPNKDDPNPIVSEDKKNPVSLNYDSDKSNDTLFDPNEEQDNTEIDKEKSNDTFFDPNVEQDNTEIDKDKSNDTFFDPNEEQDNVDDTETDKAADVVNQSSMDVPSTSQTTQRPLCMYAEKCYRKNPQHKADFCHPGDADFQAQQTPVTATTIVAAAVRPSCPYGTSCYRVNPQHKRDFDHTQPPVSPPQSPTKKSPRKARQKKTDKKKTGHWDSGSDESYDGSFIDDNENSSDDYRPDDDTEEEEEGDWE